MTTANNAQYQMEVSIYGGNRVNMFSQLTNVLANVALFCVFHLIMLFFWFFGRLIFFYQFGPAYYPIVNLYP